MAKAKHSLRLMSVMMLMSIALNGCAESETSDSETTTSTDTQTETSALPDLYSDLPTGDYGGETFTILNTSFDYAEYRLDAEELNGDNFNDAVYNRTRKVEELLSVDIEVINRDYWADNPVTDITNQVMSGDDSTDLCSLGMAKNIPAIASGIYLDLNDVDELNFDKPWWFHSNLKYYEVDGKLYTANSDASANMHDSLWAVFFNKDLAADANLGDIYKLVKDGDWTLDKMRELIEVSYNDIDGDGDMDKDDQWGLMTHYGSSFGFMHGCNVRGIDIEDGMPIITDVDDRYFDVVDTIKQLFTADGVMTNNNHQGQFGYTCVDGFSMGKGMFLAEVLGNASYFRDSNVNFGIVPYPKYDSEQENYIAYYSPAANGFCIPKTVKDISRAGTVLEVMSAYGYEMIRPAYYNIILTGRNTRDDESAEMLDIMFANTECDMAYLYQWGGYSDKLISVMTTSADTVSTLTAARPAAEAAIQKYIDSIG